MKVWILQVCCLVAIFVATLLSTFVPFSLYKRWVRNHYSGQRLLSLSNCLASGVFLATCFLGLMPTAKRKLEDALSQYKVDTTYPVCELLVLCGLVMILIIEQSSYKCQSQNWRTKRPKRNSRSRGTIENAHDNAASTKEEEMKMLSDDSDSHDEGLDSQPFGNPLNVHETVDYQEVNDINHGHSHLPSKSLGSLSSYILFLGLSIHSIFEGIAFGLQDDVNTIIYLLIAIISHECLAAFSFGLSLIKTNSRFSLSVLLCFLYSIMLPVGIGIGMGVESTQNTIGQIVSAILQSIASGTFIFVAFFEMLVHEFDSDSDRLWKVLLVFLGILPIAGLKIMDT